MSKCGQKCEVYSRVVGYYRPVNDWNIGKTAEWKDRQAYNQKESCKNKKFSEK